MIYEIKKSVLIYYLILLAFLSLPINARAHIEISPQEGPPNQWNLYRINVPTEIESPTIEIELVIPSSYEVEVIEHREKWNMSPERDAAGLIRKIKWIGSKIPPLTFEEFGFIAKNPKDAGSFWWTAYQKYENGNESTWNFQTFVKKETGAKESPPTKEAGEAIERAKVATLASFIAMGVTISLIVVVAIAIWQTSRGIK